jgi:F0F1-type ATP synthase membrane subunit b/b'
MEGITLLQIFLLINVFIIGVLTAVGVRHAWAHFRTKPEKADKPTSQPVRLPPEVREKMLAKAEAEFKAILDRASTEMQTDLKTTTANLSEQLEKLGKSIAETESERYKTTLESLRTQAETVIVAAQSEVKDHQTDIKAKLSDNIKQEQDRLIAQLDTKLGDAVSSFLTETLQHNVDLGAQMPYMIASLEEHKAELIKGITGEQ